MSDRPEPAKRSALDELREELGDQLAVAATRETKRRRGIRPALVVVIALVALAPGAVALAGGFDGGVTTHTIYVRGHAVEVDGTAIDCPATLVMLKQLGQDPCRGLKSVAPPQLSPGGSCPARIQEFLRSLHKDEARLPEYAALPGYPFEGCPTAEQLKPAFESGHIYFPPPRSAP